MEVINAIGRRKSAVARVYLSEGTGKITINKKDIETYFPSAILRYVVKQPFSCSKLRVSMILRQTSTAVVSPVRARLFASLLPARSLRSTLRTRRH